MARRCTARTPATGSPSCCSSRTGRPTSGSSTSCRGPIAARTGSALADAEPLQVVLRRGQLVVGRQAAGHHLPGLARGVREPAYVAERPRGGRVHVPRVLGDAVGLLDAERLRGPAVEAGRARVLELLVRVGDAELVQEVRRVLAHEPGVAVRGPAGPGVAAAEQEAPVRIDDDVDAVAFGVVQPPRAPVRRVVPGL